MRESRFLVGALLVVPLGGFLWFVMSEPSSTESSSGARQALEDPPSVTGSWNEASPKKAKGQARNDEGENQRGRLGSSPAEAEDDAGNRGNEAEADDVDDEESSVDDDFAERMARFDANSRAFDERLARFDEEAQASGLDEELAKSATSAIFRDVAAVAPQAKVNVQCTLSVCEVSIVDEQSVGGLIADLGPWLLQVRQGAKGDPRDARDAGHGFRLLFEAQDVPRESAP